MSYIRTKDGIYELSDGLGKTPKEVQSALMTKDYKQSDTIDELCDCLMIIDEDGDFFITQVYKINIPYYIKDKKCFGCIKIELPNGAIRIEPVAKMNEAGKLVLI